MKVKVCGMREAENIREVESLGIDLMGCIFWPKSKRYVAEPPSYLPKQVRKVGVFVDATLEDVRQHIQDYGLDIIQLHGHETPEFIANLSSLTPHLSLIKAFNIATAEDLAQTKPYEGIVDYFLFDTKAQLPGGSGQQFDWSILNAYNGETSFLLSGGIGLDDAERVKAFHHEKCIGIDLNSRFELAPGLKDVDEIKRFLEKVRK